MRKFAEQLYDILGKYPISDRDQMRIMAIVQRMGARTNPWENPDPEDFYLENSDPEDFYLENSEDLEDSEEDSDLEDFEDELRSGWF